MLTRKAAKRGSRKSKAESPQFMEKLKQFVRSQGMDFLRDRNISSIGIGYKLKDGKPTKGISVQFTVARKAALEVLESIGTADAVGGTQL